MSAGHQVLRLLHPPDEGPVMRTRTGTAPERPDYEATAWALRALTVKAHESLKTAGWIAARKTETPEGR